ncbi:MAG: pantetheine-phosphate adenylyltransferase [Bradymonadia bacterium]
MIRITGGAARGRRLKVLDTGKVRPTTDKVRQALFNVLFHSHERAPMGQRVLDLFAGSGALGLEALSRGAESVTLVEGDRRVARQLSENAAIVGEGAEIICSPVARFLSQPGPMEDLKYGLVLMDPPYAAGLVNPTLEALVTGGWLAPGAIVCVEHGPDGAPQVSAPLRPIFHRRYGECEITLLTLEEQPMRRAIYPGSFDPVTVGHIDIIRRGLQVVDEVVVTVACNIKKTPMFSDEARIEMIEMVFADEPRVKVDGFQGLLVDYATANDIPLVLRGLRSGIDFEYEQQMACMNRHLAAQTEYIFLVADPTLSYVSSSLIREIALNGGDVTGMVPPLVEARLKAEVLARQSQ